MKKVALDKELKQSKEKKTLEIDGHEAVKQVKLLEQGNAQEDLRIFNGLGEHNNIVKAQNIRGKQIELENLEKEYGEVYTVDQIKKLAMKYNLRFLRASLYTGVLDVEVASKIREFAKATNSPIDNYSLGRRYHILAPQEHFELKDELHFSKATLRAMHDPVMFYQIDDNHYRMIHKWGNDFSVFRLIEGFKWRNWWCKQAYTMATILPFVVAFFALTLNPSFIGKFSFVVNWIIPFIATFVISMFWNLQYQDDGLQIDGFFNPTNWNSESKIRKV